jgi:hypothetical protein
MAKDKFDKAFEDMKSGKIKGPTNDDSGPLPKPKEYSVESTDSKKPEPTFKSDVDNMVSGLKKVDRKINDTLDPNGILRKGMVKAAGKEERGILGDYSDLSRDFPELKKKKGGAVKKMSSGGTASSRADGCAVRGKTRA